jgi:D-alanyl-D-alanine carboxypeptidase
VAVDHGRLLDALADTGKDHGPGLFGLVLDGGEVVFSAAVGVADLTDQRPISAADRYRIGSLTKVYVASRPSTRTCAAGTQPATSASQPTRRMPSAP